MRRQQRKTFGIGLLNENTWTSTRLNFTVQYNIHGLGASSSLPFYVVSGCLFYKNSVAIVSVEDPGKIITVKTNLISLPTQACDIGFFLTEHIWVRIRKEASVNFNFPPKWANLDEIHLQRVSGCSSCCCSCYLIILYTRKGIAQGRWLCTERTKLLRSHDKHPSCKAFNCHPDI